MHIFMVNSPRVLMAWKSQWCKGLFKINKRNTICQADRNLYPSKVKSFHKPLVSQTNHVTFSFHVAVRLCCILSTKAMIIIHSINICMLSIFRLSNVNGGGEKCWGRGLARFIRWTELQVHVKTSCVTCERWWWSYRVQGRFFFGSEALE